MYAVRACFFLALLCFAVQQSTMETHVTMHILIITIYTKNKHAHEQAPQVQSFNGHASLDIWRKEAIMDTTHALVGRLPKGKKFVSAASVLGTSYELRKYATGLVLLYRRHFLCRV